MIHIIDALILGVVQGITEFLPISSSGHLLVLHRLLNFTLTNELFFDVALHFGTLIAVIIFFWHDIVRYIKAWFLSFGRWQWRENADQRIAWLIVIGSLPAIIAGYFLNNIVSTVFRSPLIVAGALFGVALLFFIFEHFAAKTRTLNDLSLYHTILIGIAQAIALIPGVSRSGITMVAGLGSKLNRVAAARFSFLVALPVIAGASFKEFLDVRGAALHGELLLAGLGFIVSVIAGLFSIKFLLNYLQKHSLSAFGIYRILLAIFIVVYFYLLT